MSIMSFFSLCSSFVRSRSSSRCAFANDRWCWRKRSAGVTVLPKSVSYDRLYIVVVFYVIIRERTTMFMVGSGEEYLLGAPTFISPGGPRPEDGLGSHRRTLLPPFLPRTRPSTYPMPL